jgi:hypothetical protein
MFCTSLFLLWLFCIFCPSIYGFSLLFGICNRFSFSFIGSCTSIKCGGVKQALEPNSPSQSKNNDVQNITQKFEDGTT